MEDFNFNQIQKGYKEISISRIMALGFLGFLLGGFFHLLFGIQLPWYILPVLIALIFGMLGYFWKVEVRESLSLEGLTSFEWVLWIPVSIAITPFISGTIAYYFYKKNNRYPKKWKQINIILLAGFIVDFTILFLVFNPLLSILPEQPNFAPSLQINAENEITDFKFINKDKMNQPSELEEARRNFRDMDRMSNIKSLQVAVEMFFDQKGYYPKALNGERLLQELKKESIIDDNYKVVFYCSRGNGDSYVLGTQLEDINSAYLDGDLDDIYYCDSGTIDCSNPTYCIKP